MHIMHMLLSMANKLRSETALFVQRARHASGLSQANFAKKMGKSQGVVSRYEQGHVSPPGEVLMHCMHILEKNSQHAEGTPQTWDALLHALDTVTNVVRDLRTEALGRNS
jgi:transcriptional regulator with XRE-family HTH domain